MANELMYIIYNQDGSIKKKKLNEFIQQGNSYANLIFVAIDQVPATSYSLEATVKLPNGYPSQIVSTSGPQEKTIEGVGTFTGLTLSFTRDQTTLPGTLKLNIVAKKITDNTILVSYTTYITVNEGVNPGDPILMTHAEYLELIEKFGVQTSSTVYAASTIASLGTLSDWTEGQYFLITTDLTHNSHTTVLQYTGNNTLALVIDCDDPAPNKVTKVITTNTVYGVDGSGNQQNFSFTQNPTPNTIAARYTDGRLKVATPVDSADATTKLYVDGNFVQKSVTTTGCEAYGRKNGTEFVWAVDDNYSANSIALRGTDGRLRVGSPNGNNDAATKQYVDATENVLHPGDVKNDLTSNDTNKPLSAYQGKVLNGKIANLESRGRFLSIWNASSGQPADLPSDIATNTYTYRNGDYFIVGTVGTKYPTGTNVPAGTTLPTFPSETRQTSAFVNDTIVYNGSTHTWTLVSGFVTATFSSIAGQPYDNANLTTALNAKQNQVIYQEEEPQNANVGDIWVKEATNNIVTYSSGTGINIANNTISVIGVEYKNNDTAQANALKFVRLTQAQYDAIETKNADTFYMIIG